jgi:hypothetical protein
MLVKQRQKKWVAKSKQFCLTKEREKVGGTGMGEGGTLKRADV